MHREPGGRAAGLFLSAGLHRMRPGVIGKQPRWAIVGAESGLLFSRRQVVRPLPFSLQGPSTLRILIRGRRFPEPLGIALTPAEHDREVRQLPGSEPGAWPGSA